MDGSKAVEAAQKLLKGSAEPFIELRIHAFQDDELAHDDDLQDRLQREFESDFRVAFDALSRSYGEPEERGEEDHDAIPQGGVFRFALWNVDDSQLYLAAAHEDRELPLLLIVGVAE